MRCGCHYHDDVRVVKGRGQRRNRRDRDGRERHRSDVVIAQYYSWSVRRGLTIDQMRDEIGELNGFSKKDSP